MKLTVSLVTMLMALSTLGCRNQTAQELLERDLRRQEDEIYALQDQLDQYRAMCRADEYETYSTQPGSSTVMPALQSPTYSSPSNSSPSFGEPSRTSPSRTTPPPRRNGDDLRPPDIQLPGMQAPPFDAPPEINPPGPNVREGELPSRRIMGAPSVTPPVVEMLEGAPTGPNLGQNDANTALPELAAITLNPRVTGGYAIDDQPGDDGVTVLIEPRTADGQLADAPGPVSIVLMDPSVAGEAGRVARWNFTADQVAERWRSSPDGKGWRFDLRWPGNRPTHNALELHVRCTSASGAKLDTQAPIDVQVATPPTVDRNQSAPRARAWTRATRPVPRPAPVPVRTEPIVPEEEPVVPRTATREWSPYR